MKKLLTLLIALSISLFAAQAERKYVADVNEQELQQMKTDGATLVDMREPYEWKKTGVIPGSLLITAPVEKKSGELDADAFVAGMKKLGISKETTLVIICQNGRRSKAMANTLAEQGWTKVYNSKKGVGGWKRKKLETRPVYDY